MQSENYRGRKTRIGYPNNTYSTYSYDKNKRVIAVQSYAVGNNTAVDSFSYTYDACGNVLTAAEKVNGVSYGQKSYEYDVLNRISAQIVPSSSGTDQDVTYYGYDAAGNRIEEMVCEANGAPAINSAT